MRCLVTGGGGFLGRYIVEQLLARGDFVRTFSRGDYPALREIGAETVVGDIQDRQKVIDACESMDTVFHTAAIAGIWGPRELFYGINTQGTVNVIDGCHEHGIKRLVFTSSPSVTFDGKDQKNVDESVPYPTDWMCAYPETKALAEQKVLAANGIDNLATCALRPHLIWGPRDGHLIPRLLDRARSGKLRIVGNGKNLVDMVYVENAAAAHLQACDRLNGDSPVAGRAYFISQGEPVNCWDWINDILALADLPRLEKRISYAAAVRVGGIFESVYRLFRIQSEPRMTRFLAAQLATDHYFDLTRAREDFGYDPPISTEEGMRRLAAEIGKHSRGT